MINGQLPIINGQLPIPNVQKLGYLKIVPKVIGMSLKIDN
jgi:hypothetical protein